MVRLDKFLADAGIGTRSEVKKQIKNRQITVNSLVAERPEHKIDPLRDQICYAGQSIIYEQFSYYLFHKPSGCVTARSDAKDKTVMDYFPEEFRKKFSPVGRLDKDTEGLLLVTNDGELNHRLVSPSYHVDKTYYARLDKPVPQNAETLFSEGIDIGDERRTLPARLVVLPDEEENGCRIYAARLTICEGRFHQVKRMFEAVGCRVLYLKRLSMGSLKLGDLPEGEFRRLTAEEIAALRQEVMEKEYEV